MMQDNRIVYVELFGEQHPMCLTVAAAEQIDSTFGSFKQLQERLASENTAQTVETMMTFAAIMLQGGRDRVEALAAMHLEQPALPVAFDLRKAYKILSLGEQNAISAAATEAFVLGSKQTVEAAPSKKEEATQ